MSEIENPELKERLKLCDRTMSEIKSLFLSLTFTQRRGYVMPLPKVMEWIEAFPDGTTSEQKRQIIEHIYQRDYIKNDEYGFDDFKLYTTIKDPENPKREICMLNDNGFKLFCLVSHYPKSTAVRLYYIQLEKDYIDALQKSHPENKKMLDILLKQKEDFLTYKKDIWYWSGEALMAKNKLLYYNKENKKLQDSLVSVGFSTMLASAKLDDLYQTRNRIKDYLADIGNTHITLKSLKKRYFRPIYMCLVDPESVNTVKKLSKVMIPIPYKMEKYMSREKVIEMDLTTESEDEQDKRNANLDKIWEHGITFDASVKPLKTQIAYYTIDTKPSQLYHKILWIPPIKKTRKSSKINKEKGKNPQKTDHLEALISFLKSKKEYNTPVKTIWKISRQTVEDFLKNIFLSEYVDPDFRKEIEIQYNNETNR